MVGDLEARRGAPDSRLASLFLQGLGEMAGGLRALYR